MLTSLADDSKYEGYFVRDLREGQGKLFIEEIEYYEGKFNNNKKNGKGILEDFVNGMVMEGTFLNDSLHGDNCQITLKSRNNQKIKGNFHHGELLFGETVL